MHFTVYADDERRVIHKWCFSFLGHWNPPPFYAYVLDTLPVFTSVLQ